MSQSTLSRRLSGSSPFRIDELAAVAALLGVRVNAFFAPLPRRAIGAAPGSRIPRMPTSTPTPGPERRTTRAAIAARATARSGSVVRTTTSCRRTA